MTSAIIATNAGPDRVAPVSGVSAPVMPAQRGSGHRLPGQPAPAALSLLRQAEEGLREAELAGDASLRFSGAHL
ncbi:MAG TPA: hypothetical protein VIQ30_03285, partial [Pseudonocardia sp.]